MVNAETSKILSALFISIFSLPSFSPKILLKSHRLTCVVFFPFFLDYIENVYTFIFELKFILITIDTTKNELKEE